MDEKFMECCRSVCQYIMPCFHWPKQNYAVYCACVWEPLVKFGWSWTVFNPSARGFTKCTNWPQFSIHVKFEMVILTIGNFTMVTPITVSSLSAVTAQCTDSWQLCSTIRCFYLVLLSGKTSIVFLSKSHVFSPPQLPWFPLCEHTLLWLLSEWIGRLDKSPAVALPGQTSTCCSNTLPMDSEDSRSLSAVLICTFGRMLFMALSRSLLSAFPLAIFSSSRCSFLLRTLFSLWHWDICKLTTAKSSSTSLQISATAALARTSMMDASWVWKARRLDIVPTIACSLAVPSFKIR